jgi:hypothetical protein
MSRIGWLFVSVVFWNPWGLADAQQATPLPGETVYDQAQGLTVVYDNAGRGTYLCFDAVADDDALAAVLLSYPVEYLELSQTKITDDGVATLAAFTSIKTLHLEQTGVGDAALEALAGLSQLEVLNLGRTQVSDAGLAHLASLGKLRELRLHGTAVTDEGLAHLAAVKGLESLWLQDTKVTPAGVQKLEDALRRVRPLSGGVTLTYTVNVKYAPPSADTSAPEKPPTSVTPTSVTPTSVTPTSD